jgi:hypothetical protein
MRNRHSAKHVSASLDHSGGYLNFGADIAVNVGHAG